ncbi:hypothetical protein EDEG_00215 [Edhazardia aedis USNM 41457]|uniref:Uncharacterized protein n=1 Tax=Edhazardia aedis (strain USNM 41457) TaxID=1003232 RepID=J9D684_EDHAE|nr:hypothetical protein EDEG_00215 [Edhazardia aedis USNM 41457]|eukprot:EJW03306.1 hypothetical protein EDEG_00215 [Edhazardia aedis USNM 41457]
MIHFNLFALKNFLHVTILDTCIFFLCRYLFYYSDLKILFNIFFVRIFLLCDDGLFRKNTQHKFTVLLICRDTSIILHYNFKQIFSIAFLKKQKARKNEWFRHQNYKTNKFN